MVGLPWSRAWERAWHPGGIPSFDVADYVLRAMRLHDLAARGSVGALARDLVEPDRHPPGHPALLATWMLLAGDTMRAACALSFLWNCAGCVLLLALGRRLFGARGWWIGAFSAALLALSPLHVRLLASPMSEPVAFVAACVAWLVASWALQADRVAPRIVGGLLVAAAGLIRYSLVPFLVVPILLGEVVAGSRRLPLNLAGRALVWLLPTVAGIAAWSFARMGATTQIALFFLRPAPEAGEPSLDKAEIFWLFGAFLEHCVPTGWMGVAILSLFVVTLPRSLLRWRKQPLLLVLPVFVVLAWALLSLHNFLQPRNLHAVAPILFLLAMDSLWWIGEQAAARFGRWAFALAPAAFLAMYGSGLAAAGTAGSDEDLEFIENRRLRHALDAIADHAAASERIVVGGAHRMLNRHVIALWLRERNLDDRLVFEPSYPAACRRSDTPDEAGCSPATTLRLLDDPDAADTAFVAISKVGPMAMGDGRPSTHWSQRYARQVADEMRLRGAETVDELDVRDPPMRVVIWRLPR